MLPQRPWSSPTVAKKTAGRYREGIIEGEIVTVPTYPASPYATPPGPAPRGRPITVTIASYLLYGAAALEVITAIMSLSTVGRTYDVVRDAYAGTADGSGIADVVLASAIVGAAINVLLAAGFAVLGALDSRGKNPARIVTWVVGGLSVCCSGIGLGGQAAISTTYTSTDPSGNLSQSQLNQSINDALPQWYRPVTLTLAAITLLAILAVIVLLALPASNAFFRKAVTGFPLPPFGYPPQQYPQYPQSGQYGYPGQPAPGLAPYPGQPAPPPGGAPYGGPPGGAPYAGPSGGAPYAGPPGGAPYGAPPGMAPYVGPPGGASYAGPPAGGPPAGGPSAGGPSAGGPSADGPPFGGSSFGGPPAGWSSGAPSGAPYGPPPGWVPPPVGGEPSAVQSDQPPVGDLPAEPAGPPPTAHDGQSAAPHAVGGRMAEFSGEQRPERVGQESGPVRERAAEGSEEGAQSPDVAGPDASRPEGGERREPGESA
jgi:hypothetical protein